MVLVCGGLLWLAPLSSRAVTSTFDTGLEGWTAVGIDVSYQFLPPYLTGIAITNNAGDMVHAGADGNPGGYAQLTDTIVEPSSLASAPAAYLGDLTAYIGGTFSFDHRLFTEGANVAMPHAPYSLVLYSGAPVNLDGLIWTAPAPMGPTDWIHFDITLDTNDLTPIADVSLSVLDPTLPDVTPRSLGLGGSMTFEEIMADVDGILVAFELVDNQGAQMTELAGLDNVRMVPVPEPASAAMLALGLLGLTLRARARS
jgi:hypothetical protein